MKFLVSTGLCAVGLLLSGLFTDASALSLGRVRGAVLIGRPLEVTVQLPLDQTDDPANLCLEADVLYGDAKIAPARVRLSGENLGSTQASSVRIAATAPVDEPVVTVFMRAGCNQKVSRRYVLLAEPAVDSPAAPAAAVVPEAPTAAASAPIPSPASTPAAASGAGTPAAGAASRRSRATTPVPAGGTESAPARSRPAREPASPPRAAAPDANRADAPLQLRSGNRLDTRKNARSRLKLEALDLSVERNPQLKSSPDLLSTPTQDANQRAAAAALYRALSAPPADLLRDAERLRALEREITTLRATAVKSNATITDLNSKLREAESERYLNWVVYSLALLLVAAVAAAGYLWLRSRHMHAQQWWNAMDQDPLPDDEGDGFVGGAADIPLARGPLSKVSAPAPLRSASEEDEPSSFFDSEPGPARDGSGDDDQPYTMDRPDFVASMPGIPRTVNAEELFDIQQQADFFMSLGQHEQAIDVLKTHINDNIETSAVAYLDLFKIYHQLNRRDDYDALRADFNKVFNAEVPTFENFTERGHGLEAYQLALSRIEALWPSPKVLDVIEESIFRKPGSAGEAFDLEAYRELMLLYAMAKDLVDRKEDLMTFEPSGVGPSFGDEKTRFSSTVIQPLSAVEIPSYDRNDSGSAGPDVQSLDVDMDIFPEINLPRNGSAMLGLDIDLSDADAAAAAQPDAEAPMPDLPFDISDIDIAAEPSAPAEPDSAAAPDSNLLDFDMFDSALEFELNKKPDKKT